MLPWPDMLRAGLMLGLSPKAFWSCSLREWRWLTSDGGQTLGRARLEQLIENYPDPEKEERDGTL